MHILYVLHYYIVQYNTYDSVIIPYLLKWTPQLHFLGPKRCGVYLKAATIQSMCTLALLSKYYIVRAWLAKIMKHVVLTALCVGIHIQDSVDSKKMYPSA